MRFFTASTSHLLVVAAFGLAATACASAALDSTDEGTAADAVVVEGSTTTEPPQETASTTEVEEVVTTSSTVGADLAPDVDALAERLAAFLLANPDGLEIDEASAACTGEALASTLPADRMELLVTNLEEFDELEQGRQFSVEERLTIAEGFARCLDFAVVIDETVLDDPGLAAVVACIEAERGTDRVETVMLAAALGEDYSSPANSVLAEAFAVCPELARGTLADLIADRMSVDSMAVASCLEVFSDEELVRHVSGTEDLFTLIEQLEPTCFVNR